MKKFLSVLLSVIMVAALASAAMAQETPEIGRLYAGQGI